MPLYSIQGPDGRTYSIEGPPGATREQVIQAIQARMQETPQTVTAPPAPEPEQSGFFRQALDVPVQVSRGVVGGIRMLADVFGSGSSASEALKSADTWLADLLSAEAKNDQRRIAQILKDAEDKGVLDQVKAGFQAFLVAPGDTLSQVLGSTAPVLIAGLASGPVGALLGTARVGAVAMPAVGAAMGVGEVKGSIYESVKEAYKQKGASDEIAEAKAQEAQAYSGANLPSLVAAGGLGALAGRFGIEAPLTSILRGGARETAEQQALRAAERGLLARTGIGAFTESAPEFAQAGQSKLAENIALRNEGFDVPLFQGVFGAAAMEGAAGAVLGGGLAIPRSGVNRLPGQRDGESDADFARRLSREIDAARQRQQITPLAQPISPAEAPAEAPTQPIVSTEGVDLYRFPDGTTGTLEQAKAYAMSVPPQQRMQVIQQILANRIPKEAVTPPDLFTKPAEVAEKSAEVPVEVKPTEEVKPVEALKPTEEIKVEEIKPGQAVTKEEEEAAVDAVKPLEQAAVSGLPIIEAPLDQLTLSKDVPQFKSDADAKGVVEPLGGTFDRRGVAPIQVWKRNDGRMEVISGRHRLDLAQRSGEKTIPAQIHEEATGFDAKQAAMLDAELNIRDQQGKVKDYVAYFENAGISEADADSRGLLARAPGKQGFAIASRGSPELIAAHRADVIPDAGAAAIANAAPGDSRLQAVGIKAIQEGKSPLAAVNLIKAVQTISKDQPPSDGGDLFGFDDSAMREAEDMAKIATLKQNQLAQRLAAISGASRRPEIAKKEGIDIKDPEALKKREKELRQQKAAWDNWPSSPELVQEIRQEMAPKAPEEAKPSVREAPAAKEPSPELQAKIDLLGKALTRIMSRYGLKDVALKLVADMKAEGEYSSRVLSLALDAADPVSALRHESIHAMKELGFFSDQQWKALERQAKEKWINQYLKQKNVNRQPLQEGQTSRYDAYMNLYGGDEEAVIEEAIADAFADFDATKAPPGMLQALLKKIQNFFQAIKEAFGAEPDAERIFRKAERGELRGREVAPVEEPIKPSLREVPLSTRGLMEVQPIVAMQELGLKTESTPKPGGIELFNDVRSIAQALNRDTVVNQGVIGEKDVSTTSVRKIAKAVADEIAYQVKSTSKTGTGLGWYSNNYPNAVRKLAKEFPELETSEYARTVFSALVAITSNGEKVAINVKNAKKLYEQVRAGKDMIAPGTRRDDALENNIAMLRMLMAKHGKNLRAELMREITVKDMNAALRQMGQEPDGSYLANATVPASAIYFGPKLGAFFSNLEGAEGYLTMDLWWTRTINRMRGLLIPKATPNSIKNFRLMMDQPNATRDEVVAATIPLKQKYEQQNFVTELEFLVSERYRKAVEREFRGDDKKIEKELKKVSKEPSSQSPKFAKWHATAKKMAGAAYQQLLFEHKLEKLANSIHKNEYEMLEEAPFTASDRQFMYRIAREAQRMLQREDINLSIADIQAALWYYEKRLYQHLSGRKADDIGYDEAITQLARDSTGPAEPSVVFGGEPAGGAEPAGAGAEAGGVRGKPAEQPRLSLRAPQTEAFKRWFGDSKVVDADGNPLVFYHGTGADITAFDKSKIATATDGGIYGVGFYFAKNPDLAESYALQSSAYAGGAPNILPVFLSIKNPFYAGGGSDALSVIYKIAGKRPKNMSGEEGIAWAKKLRKGLIELGYDGVFETDPNSPANYANEVVAFYPEQIKSATGNVGTFDPTNPDIRYSLRDKLGMYSELENKIEAGSNKAPADSWKAYINGLTQKGVKPEEIEWSGVRDWLDLQKGTVTKEELLNYLKQGGVRVEETVLRDWGLDEDEIDIHGRAAKYGQYTLPGGENYREVLLTLPSESRGKHELAKQTWIKFQEQMREKYNGSFAWRRKATKEENAEADRLVAELDKAAYGIVDYKSGHWDQSNIIAHIRLNDRTDADGNKVLFVEEIQSDWGQKGKKKGFALPPKEDAELDGLLKIPSWERTPSQIQRVEELNGKRLRGVPFAPFVTKTEGWLNLALKRIMVMAAEGGYDKVAFVNGKQSVDRYDLSKQIDRIDHNKNGDGTYNLSAIKDGKEIFSKEEINESELENLVGKEVAQKIVAGEGQLPQELGTVDRWEPEDRPELGEKDFDFDATPVRSLSGLDLKVGGEGMKTFYDTIVPTAVKKLLPKVGGGQMMQVGVQVPPASAIDPARTTLRETIQQPGFNVTPAMRNKVQTTGLPRFSLRNTASWSDKRIDSLINEYGYTDGRTKAYAARISPSDFVYSTTPTEEVAREIYDEAGKLDIKELTRESQTPFLYIETSGDNWQIVGHEGRHRMAAMDAAGITDAPVVLVMYKNGGRAPSMYEPEASHGLEGQDFPRYETPGQGTSSTVRKLTPLSYKYNQQLKEEFGRESRVKFSLREGPRLNLRDATDPATRARIDQTTTPRDEKTFIQRITEAIAPKSASHFRAAFLNRYDRLADYDKELVRQMGGAPLLADSSAEAAALMSDLSAGVMASAMGVYDRVGGIPVYVNGHTKVVNNNNTVKGPIAIFAPLAKYNDPFIYQKYQFWAAVNRGLRLYGQGRDTELITPADKTEAAKILVDHPEFADIQKEWITFNNGLVKYLLDTGVLTEKSAQEFVKYADYIPFYRQVEGEETVGPQIFASLSGVKAPKKLKGSQAPLGEFLETVVRNVQYSIEAGMKNSAAQKAVNVAQAIGQADRLNYVSSAPNVIKILERGKPTYYASKDPLFIDAMKSLNLGDLPFIGLLSAPANLLRSLVTKDPAFMLANMMRDSMSAWVTSGVKMRPIVDTLTNFGKALRKQNPEYAALLDSGVIGGYDYSQGIEVSADRFNRELRKEANVYTTGEKIAKPFVSLWDALEKGTMASDAATRMEVYKKTLAETNNEAEALFRSLEVMNFNRKGNNPMVRVLTAAVPFLNARMQGLDVLYRAAFAKGSDIDPKEIQKRFFVRGMTIAALSTMYWMLASEDDEWKKQEQETRDNYWIIPSLGVKIPIPFEIGVLFKVIPERILEYSFGDDTGKDFLKSMSRQLMSTLAFNPIPQTVLPVIESVTNFSFFTMRPIVSQGLEDVNPAYQIGPTTSRLGELIGGTTRDLPTALQISPTKVDALIRGYTGTIGGYMVDLFDAIYDMNSDAPKAAKRFEQMPVIRRFAVDPQARGQVTAYYELKNAVDEAVRTSNLLERNMQPQEWGEYFQENKGLFAVKDYVLDLEKSMKQYREMKNFVRASSMDADQKKDIILNITTLENQLASNIQQIKKMSSGQ